jgi:ABC-type dipeptide/oligopeptide/nickel transport system ATPase component
VTAREGSRLRSRRPLGQPARGGLSPHNIGVVEYIAVEVAVMRAGRIVEQGPSGQVLRAPQHEYTRTLLAAVPRLQSAA